MNVLFRCSMSQSELVARNQALHYIKCLFRTNEQVVRVGKCYFTANKSYSQRALVLNIQQATSKPNCTILESRSSLKFDRSLVTLNMTNKPRYISSSSESRNATSDDRFKSNSRNQPSTNYNDTKNLSSTNGHTHPSQIQPFNLVDNINFKTMASVQKLAMEPTREHIDNIRQILKYRNAKDNDDQDITLEKDQESGIGIIRIKSAAKNGISAKMMCDFLDIIDELYSWPQGKGVLIYGHNGFFCSGECSTSIIGCPDESNRASWSQY